MPAQFASGRVLLLEVLERDEEAFANDVSCSARTSSASMVRLATFSLEYVEYRVFSTVRTLSASFLAISRFENPSATSVAICRSRGDRPAVSEYSIIRGYRVPQGAEYP